MAVTRKGWIAIFVSFGLAILAIILYVYRDKLFGKKVPDPNASNTPVPLGSASPKWVEEKFDLDLGMYGPMIAKLQKALGISDDGKFGNQTKTTLVGKGYTVPLKKADYDKIINPPSASGGNNFNDLKKKLEGGYTNFSGGIIYPISGQNKQYKFQFYDNGRWSVFLINGTGYLKKGSYTNGGNAMTVDGGGYFGYGGPYANMTNIIKKELKD